MDHTLYDEKGDYIAYIKSALSTVNFFSIASDAPPVNSVHVREYVIRHTNNLEPTSSRPDGMERLRRPAGRLNLHIGMIKAASFAYSLVRLVAVAAATGLDLHCREPISECDAT